VSATGHRGRSRPEAVAVVTVSSLVATLVIVGLGAGCSLIAPLDGYTFVSGDAGIDAGETADAATTADAGTDAAVADAGRPPPCGDGMLDGAEECDDGNTDADDGCSDTCTVEDGWTCDGAEPDVCSETCGDGMMVGSEVCDDGFETACGDCNADCTAAGSGSMCSDGMICTDTEVCDDGNTDDLDGCAADCTMVETGWVCSMEPSVCAETCSNGVLDMGEECDDGANADGDGCSAACTEESGWTCMGEPSTCETTCGDSIIAGAEECDDGNTDDDDGCDSSCEEEPGWTCTGTPMSTCDEDCGDSMMVGAEVCDDGDTMTETACDYGTATCTLCNADCSMELMLMGNICGDGVVSPGDEACDDNNTSDCGLCNASCSVMRIAAAATGTIRALAAAATTDGGTFTLNDGVNPPVIFEIDSLNDGLADASAVEVDTTGLDAGGSAVTTAGVINSLGTLDISASFSGDTVTLANDRAGEIGNVTIANSGLAADGWSFSGMREGVGRTCAGGVGCTDDDDCRSGNCELGICEIGDGSAARHALPPHE